MRGRVATSPSTPGARGGRIYIPEGVLMSAFERGYHPWAFSEILLQEAWKLLDYYLIVELARRYQLWMHRHAGVPGFYFVKDTLLGLNKHRRISGERERSMRRRFRRNSERGQRRQTVGRRAVARARPAGDWGDQYQ